jgi:hypothetical protein
MTQQKCIVSKRRAVHRSRAFFPNQHNVETLDCNFHWNSMSNELHRQKKKTTTRKNLALCVFNVLGIPFIYYLLHDLHPPNHNTKIVHTHQK